MLKRFWQWLVQRLQRWFRKASPTEAIAPTHQPTLNTSDYEFLFMQLLEGVSHGWDAAQVERFWHNLSDRTTPQSWQTWLEEFGDRLLGSPTPHHELATRMLKLGQLDPTPFGQQARTLGNSLLKKAIPTGETLPLSEAAKQLFEKGNQQYQDGLFQGAIASWDGAIALKPDFYQAWTNRGVALNILKRYEEAITSYDKALEIKSDYDLAWTNRGLSLKNLGRYPEALSSYEKALQLQPQSFEAWLNRGTILSASPQTQAEAMTCFQQAIALQPQRYEAWYGYGEMLMVFDRYDDAVQTWQQAVNLNPSLQVGWRQLGKALYLVNHYEDAIAACEQAMNLYAHDEEAISYWSKSRARLNPITEPPTDPAQPEE